MRINSNKIISIIILTISLFTIESNGSPIMVDPDFNDPDDIYMLIWDFKSNEVIQSENYSIKLTIYNLNNENILIRSLGLHFDWFGNESYNKHQPIYQYPDNLKKENPTIFTNSLKNYYFNGTLGKNVSIGSHQYHFEIITDTPKRANFTDTGAILPLYSWISPTFSDFNVLECDSDNDGFGDSEDKFPYDPYEYRDSDLDGVGDSLDNFPLNQSEWLDSDNDGFGDNCDSFPRDVEEWMDSDNDGMGDNSDSFPLDPSASIDLDNDGYPDIWNPNMNEMNSTTGLKLDHYPFDPEKYKTEDGIDISIILIILFYIFLLIIIMIEFIIIIKGKKSLFQD